MSESQEALLLVVALLGPATLALIPLAPLWLRTPIVLAAPPVWALVAWALVAAAFGQAAETGEVAARSVLGQPLPGVALRLAAEPLGAFFAAIFSTVGALAFWNAAGHARALDRRDAPWPAMAGCVAAANGVALADTLFTLLVFACALALSGAALLHRGRGAAVGGPAGAQLAVFLCGAMGLATPAMAWTHTLTGDGGLSDGGAALAGVDGLIATQLLVLFVLGLSSLAVPPFQRIAVSGAGEADGPIGAMAMGVGAAAGALATVKVVVFAFGATGDGALVARAALAALALFGALGASVFALAQADARARIARLCAAQLGVALAGALLGGPAGVFGAALQLTTLSCGAAVLFMAAAAVDAATGRREMAAFQGVGRLMPFTMSAFAVATLAFAGFAPLAGAWARLWLSADPGPGAIGAIAVGANVLVGLLAFAALAPTAVRALFGPTPRQMDFRPDAGSVILVAPIALCALLLAGVVAFAEPLSRALAPGLAGAFG